MTAKWKVSPDMKSTKLSAQSSRRPRAVMMSVWVPPSTRRSGVTWPMTKQQTKPGHRCEGVLNVTIMLVSISGGLKVWTTITTSQYTLKFEGKMVYKHTPSPLNKLIVIIVDIHVIYVFINLSCDFVLVCSNGKGHTRGLNVSVVCS